MEERVERLENLMDLSIRLHESMQRSQAIMEQNQLRMDENHRELEENFRELRRNQAEMAELVQRLTQAVTVVQADIVRIDETHT